MKFPLHLFTLASPHILIHHSLPPSPHQVHLRRGGQAEQYSGGGELSGADAWFAVRHGGAGVRDVRYEILPSVQAQGS